MTLEELRVKVRELADEHGGDSSLINREFWDFAHNGRHRGPEEEWSVVLWIGSRLYTASAPTAELALERLQKALPNIPDSVAVEMAEMA